MGNLGFTTQRFVAYAMVQSRKSGSRRYRNIAGLHECQHQHGRYDREDDDHEEATAATLLYDLGDYLRRGRLPRRDGPTALRTSRRLIGDAVPAVLTLDQRHSPPSPTNPV